MFTHTYWAARRPGIRSLVRVVCASSLLVVGMATSIPAQVAQQQAITVESLIGSAISDLGPKYDDVQQAIDRFMRGDVAGAHQFLVNAQQKHAQLPPPDISLAKMQMVAGNVVPARALLERAVREHPDDAEAYLMIADLAFPDGRLTEAGCLYDVSATLIEKMTGNEKRKRGFAIRTHAGRAAVAERRGDFEQAKGHLTAWVEADPESATAHHRLGTTLFRLAKQQTDYAAAYDEFNKARTLEATLPHPDVTTAKLFHQMKDQAKAREFFTRAAEQDGKNAETLFAYAQWLMEIGDAPASLQPLGDARLLKPENAQLLLFSGVAAKMAGNMDEAEQFLLDAMKYAPASQDVLNQLAVTLAATEDDDKKKRALQFAQVSSTLFPQNNESAVTLGFALYRNGRLQDAERAIQNALRMGQLNSDSSYLIARILFENNKPEDAARILDSVVDDAGIFVHRDQAQQLRTQIGRATAGGNAPPATGGGP